MWRMMKVVLLFVSIGFLGACNNAGSVKAEIDTAVNEVKNIKVPDSISAKSERVLDSIGRKVKEVADSSKAKGGRVLQKMDEALKSVKKKVDTTK